MARILSFPATDDALVQRVRAGDQDAFEAIVDRYSTRLVGYARSILGGAHHDAEDVVQDALLSAHAALVRDDREMALGAWLHTIVRNRALDTLRRRRPAADIDALALTLGERDSDPAVGFERRAQLEAILTGLHDLPERQRTALVLRELAGASHKAIGERLHVSETASKTLVHRARRGLERRMAAAA